MDAPNNVEITLDYMLSLKIFIESEYNGSIVIIIKKIYNFLKELNKTDLEIKNAINLLYSSIDPSRLDNVNYVIDRIIATNNQIIGSNNPTQFENIIDPYTSNFTNPTLFFNMFETNINNLLNNNNSTFYNIINNYNNVDNANNNTNNDIEDTDDSDDIDNNTNDNTIPTLIPINYNIVAPELFYFINNAINNIVPQIEQINSNVTTTEILNQKTIIKKYVEFDNKIKEKYKTCTFCLDDYNNDANIRQLKCEHIFHPHCIDPWVLNEDYKCPVCRDDSLIPVLSSEPNT